MARTNRTGYKNSWQREHTDRISLTVPKGYKAELQSHAEQHSQSLNAFINRSIQEAIERDTESDEIERIAREADVPIEKAHKRIEIEKALRELESEYPGIREMLERCTSLAD